MTVVKFGGMPKASSQKYRREESAFVAGGGIQVPGAGMRFWGPLTSPIPSFGGNDEAPAGVVAGSRESTCPGAGGGPNWCCTDRAAPTRLLKLR